MFAVTLLFLFFVAPPYVFALPHAGVSVNQSKPQTTEIKKGEIVDSVSCTDDPSQSYAVYLPSNYSPDHKWPVLYALDPGARGKAPLEHYKDAAEKWGWILIASNNSRNGNMQRSLAAWNAMVKDSQARFNIDDQRGYATGFSGGARVAMYIATQCKNCLAGLITSGAGFPAGPSNAPVPVPTFATAGVDDFNFPEIKRLDQALNKSATPHQIAIFGGGHDWPPAGIASQAIEWFELQAMRSGARPRSEQQIESLWQARMKNASNFEQEKKVVDAYRTYADIVSSFSGLHDVATAQDKVNQLHNEREVKNLSRDEETQIARQREFDIRLRTLIARSQRVALDDEQSAREAEGRNENEAADPNPENQLKSLLSDLRKQSTEPEDTGERRVARRVLSGMFIALFERGNDLLQNQKRFEAAARTFELASEVNPERGGVFYYAAWAHAADGNKKKALRALRTATEKGFSDLTAITNNHAFDSLRDDAEYQEIVKAMQSKKST